MYMTQARDLDSRVGGGNTERKILDYNKNNFLTLSYQSSTIRLTHGDHLALLFATARSRWT
jgi:hypothetical protein